MRKLAPALAALALIAGCGGGDKAGTIPSKQASGLTKQLDQVADDVSNGRCGGATFKVGQLEEKVTSLPSGVDQPVRSKIQQGLDNLRSLVEGECQRPQATDTQPSTTETTPPTTDTQPTETQPTETQPTETQKDKKPKDEQPPGQTTPTTPTTPGGSPAPGAGGTPLPGDEG